MKKSDKKIDNNLRTVLTDICEGEKDNIDGFQWLTHHVNYADFPASLRIICVFEDNETLQKAQDNGQCQALARLIIKQLQTLVPAQGMKGKSLDKCIQLDSEENCQREHQGNWARRLA